MDKIAVFGLGSMGFGMASSLVRAGHPTYGFDTRDAAVAQLLDAGGLSADLGEIAASLGAVVVVVLNAEQTESVLFGETGVVPQLKSGAVVMACATVPPAFARDMARRCAEHGVHYLDAPISGGAQKSAEGALSVMASGAPAAFNAARPVLDAVATKVFELG
ncbi:MAG: NAD(P)-binding domain-containing protein, partial [Pseudomonadota bacterium]